MRTFVHRDFELSSNWEFLHQEIRKVKSLLGKYEYPPCGINKEIKLLPKFASSTAKKRILAKSFGNVFL